MHWVNLFNILSQETGTLHVPTNQQHPQLWNGQRKEKGTQHVHCVNVDEVDSNHMHQQPILSSMFTPLFIYEIY